MSKKYNEAADSHSMKSDDLSPRGEVIEASNRGRKPGRSARRLVGIVVGSLSAVVGIAGPAHAATYGMGAVRYDSNCGVAGSSMNSVFQATASPDGSSKVDLLNLKASARIYLPGACAPATQICLDQRIIAQTTGGQIATTGNFGSLGWVWGSYRSVITGNTASAFGTDCKSLYGTRTATIAVDADPSYSVFIFSGRYKLANYKYETRVRWYGGGSWHYGNWASYSKTM